MVRAMRTRTNRYDDIANTIGTGSKTKYYWAWWIDPVDSKPYIRGPYSSISDLNMAVSRIWQGHYDIHETTHIDPARVKSELRDVMATAVGNFEMAKKMRPGDVDIQVLIVEELMDHECSKHGIQYARELMSLAPNDARSYFYLGLAYHFDDMYDEAMDTLIEGLEIAEETGNDEMINEIEGLYSHIEFINGPFGRLWGGGIESLLDGGIESLLDGFFDEEEY